MLRHISNIRRGDRVDTVRPIFDIGYGQTDRESLTVVLGEQELVVVLIGVIGDQFGFGAFEFTSFGWCAVQRARPRPPRR